MKVIWDTQNDEPLYAVNQDALRKTVNREAKRFRLYVKLFEFVMVVVPLFMAALFLKDPLIEGINQHRVVSGLIMLGVFVYFLRGILKRRRHEKAFDASMFGDLEKAIWQVDNHIARTFGVRQGVIIPMVVTFVLDIVFLYATKPVWMYVCAISVMGAAYYAIDREVRCMYAPRKRKLEALRQKLVETPESSLPGTPDAVMV